MKMVRESKTGFAAREAWKQLWLYDCNFTRLASLYWSTPRRIVSACHIYVSEKLLK